MTDESRFRRLEDIWDAAMKRPPADRAAFLREACGDDDAIRLELEATLVNVSRAEMFLEQPLAALAAHAMEPSTDTVLTGLRLNTLVIGKMIGAGGMGQVYRARDTELNRDVAVKVLSPEFADDADRLARFAREARVLASLNHPNIAHIHGLQSSGAVTAIVMELVAGETLADRIARGPIAVNEALPHRTADCRGARSRARAGRHSSRPEAREHPGPHRRHGQGARLRSGQDGPSDKRGGRRPECRGALIGTGRGSRDGRLHVAGAGEAEAGRPPCGHVGLRMRPVRDAHRAAGVCRRNAIGSDVRGHRGRTRLEGAAGIHTAGRSPIAAALPREGLRDGGWTRRRWPGSRSTRPKESRRVSYRAARTHSHARHGHWCPGC